MMPTLNLVDRVLAMGRRYQEAGRHRDAVSVFTRLARFRYLPAEAAEETQARLAEIQLKRRKYRHARRHLTAALRHQPDNARYHYLLAIALQAEEGADLQRAGEHYRRALELDPGHVKCLADYGHLLLRLGQTDEGLERLRQAAEGAPGDVEVLGKLVKGLRLTGRTDEARSVLQIALFRNSRSPRFRKLWNEFRFQQARRRRETERLQCNGEAEAEQPVLLPFVRVVPDDQTDSDMPMVVRREESNAAGRARSFRLPRRSERRNVQ
jgi:Tfp pilus assembly protein PilF